jgi:hypothetical protein
MLLKTMPLKKNLKPFEPYLEILHPPDAVHPGLAPRTPPLKTNPPPMIDPDVVDPRRIISDTAATTPQTWGED